MKYGKNVIQKLKTWLKLNTQYYYYYFQGKMEEYDLCQKSCEVKYKD